MYLGRFSKIKNYKTDCKPTKNGASLRFYNPNKIEKDGEFVEQLCFSIVKKLCELIGFDIPKNKPFSIFIVEGETI